jgi:putative serine protease PepD
MRGNGWAAILISGLLGGIVGAAVLFGLIQAFGGSGSSKAAGTDNARRLSNVGTALSAGAATRTGVDAEAIYAQVRPSVVTIEVTTTGRRRQAQGEGTGIVLDTSGHILTNDHVVEPANTITVSLATGQSYSATVVTKDTTNDLAVISVPAPANLLHPAKLGDASTLRVGEPVVAIGNPLGYEATLTEGIISGLDRTFDDGQGTTMQHLVQSDAAINPGNSGGPLLDGSGAVVGVNTLLDNADGSDNFSGLGFSVPINTAQSLIRQATTKGG